MQEAEVVGYLRKIIFTPNSGAGMLLIVLYTEDRIKTFDCNIFTWVHLQGGLLTFIPFCASMLHLAGCVSSSSGESRATLKFVSSKCERSSRENGSKLTSLTTNTRTLLPVQRYFSATVLFNFSSVLHWSPARSSSLVSLIHGRVAQPRCPVRTAGRRVQTESGGTLVQRRWGVGGGSFLSH